MQTQFFSTIKAATEGGALNTDDRNTAIRPQDRYTIRPQVNFECPDAPQRQQQAPSWPESSAP